MSYQEGATDPFDTGITNFSPETPDLGAVILEAMRQWGLGLRVALPCAITALHGNQLVDLQPLLMARYKVGAPGPRRMPIITRALVAMPMGQNYAIRLPLAVGDTGLAIFCDRSLDAWASGKGGVVDPADCRAHDLTDAIFYPGLVPVSGQTADTSADLTITNGKAQFRASPTGQFKIGNGAAELVSLLQQLATGVSALATLVGTTSPSALIPAGQQSAAATAIADLAASLKES